LCASDNNYINTVGGAKVRISFSKDVIIYENSYTNASNDIVSRRSTVNTLCIDVYGGQYGGVLELAIEDGGNRLVWEDETIFASPIEIDAGERKEIKIDCVAYNRSTSINDIKAKLRFSENLSGQIVEQEDPITVVQVEVEPLVTIGEFINRHKVGIGETVICRAYPRSINWNIGYSTNVFMPNEFNEVSFRCQYHELNDFLQFTVADVDYSTSLEVIQPTGVSVKSAEELIFSNAVTNKAGWAGMVLDLIVIPTNVCFSSLHIMEIPEYAQKISPTGYFSAAVFSSIWHHTTLMGAGVWHRVQNDNHFLFDYAQCGEVLPDNWSNGQITWRIPTAWTHIENGIEECQTNEFGEINYQLFRMFSNGTLRVEKFDDYWVERTAQGVHNRSAKVKKGNIFYED
jgi:hypothetical protein